MAWINLMFLSSHVFVVAGKLTLFCRQFIGKLFWNLFPAAFDLFRISRSRFYWMKTCWKDIEMLSWRKFTIHKESLCSFISPARISTLIFQLSPLRSCWRCALLSFTSEIHTNASQLNSWIDYREEEVEKERMNEEEIFNKRNSIRGFLMLPPPHNGCSLTFIHPPPPPPTEYISLTLDVLCAFLNWVLWATEHNMMITLGRWWKTG